MFILAVSEEVTSHRTSTGILVLRFSIQILALKLAELDHFVRLIFKASASPAHCTAAMTGWRTMGANWL